MATARMRWTLVGAAETWDIYGSLDAADDLVASLPADHPALLMTFKSASGARWRLPGWNHGDKWMDGGFIKDSETLSMKMLIVKSCSVFFCFILCCVLSLHIQLSWKCMCGYRLRDRRAYNQTTDDIACPIRRQKNPGQGCGFLFLLGSSGNP